MLPSFRSLFLWVTLVSAGGWLLQLTETCAAQDNASRPVVVCSTTQVAEFARQIAGDRWEVVCVLGAGEDPHTYEVGNDDLISVKRSTLCLDNGWNLEGHDWMRKLATNAGKPIVSCVEGVKPLVTDEDGESVNDPHAWFDLDNAMIYVANVRNALRELDPDHAQEYNDRAKLYLLQLRVLKQWAAAQVNQVAKSQRILVTHHDAFGYFARAYGFRAVSPEGWTTGELAGVSIEQRQGVVKQIRELGVKAIFVETSTNEELLDGIARETGVGIGGSLYSDAMGPADSAGESFIGMYRENVLTIVNALK